MHLQVYPQEHSCLHCQVDHQLRRKIFFFTFLCIFKCSLNWSLNCAFKCNINSPLKLTFLLNRLVHALLCINKYTTMCIFKWNSIVTSNTHLVSISNAPSCASLYRSQLHWQMHPQVHHQVQRQTYYFSYLLLHLRWLFKVNSMVHLQLQHQVAH